MSASTKEILEALAATAVLAVLFFELILFAAVLEPEPVQPIDPGRSSAVRAPALGAGHVAGSNPAAPTIYEAER